MMAPEWLNAVVRDFGRAAGADTFALNDCGAAAISFETGVGLRFEYTGMELVVAVTVPSPANPVALRRALSFAHPMAGVGSDTDLTVMAAEHGGWMFLSFLICTLPLIPAMIFGYRYGCKRRQRDREELTGEKTGK